MMGNIDGRFEYGWNRCANNIINACNFIFKEFFKKIAYCSVKLRGFFHLKER